MKEEKNDGYTFQGNGLSGKQKDWAERRFNQYLASYPHIHNLSDLSTLENLVYYEAMHENLKIKIAELTKDKTKDASHPISPGLQTQLSENLNMQHELREMLGFSQDKKVLDAFQDFKNLEEKFAQYRRQNPDQFEVACPQCAFIFYLKRRTKDYETVTASWFKDKVLFNEALFKVYKEQRPLTKTDLSQILGVSEFQIDWIEEKYIQINNPSQEPPTDSSTDTSSDSSTNTPEPPQQ